MVYPARAIMGDKPYGGDTLVNINSTPREHWLVVWEDGFAPGISTCGLAALKDALDRDDPRLIQGATTTPPPLMSVQDWPVEGACGASYCGWQGDGLTTVGDVEEYFAKLCYECDVRLDEPAACRWFLNMFDDGPRHEVFQKLSASIAGTLERRRQQEMAAAALDDHPTENTSA